MFLFLFIRRTASRPSSNRILIAKILLGTMAAFMLCSAVVAIVLVCYVAVRDAQTTTTSTTTTTSATTTTATTATTTTATTTTSVTTTTTQTTITFSAVGIYALNIPTCATWNENGTTVSGNQNGSIGYDLGSLNYPVSIFIDNDDILYVCDRDNSRILKLYPNSSTAVIVAGNGTAGNESNQLRGPKGVAVDQYGAIIVADSDNYRIQKFLPNSTIGITLASNTSYNPLGQMRDLHIDVNNNIYVTDSDNNQVVKYIPYSSIGIVLAGGGPSGAGLNQLFSPFGNFMDANNSLYVADSGNHRVLKYLPGSLNGTIVAGNGTAGASLYQLYLPRSVIVDNNGVVKWTTNYAAGGVCIMGCTGTTGTAANQMRGPRDLKFDRHGNIYVTDQSNQRIQKYMIQLPTSPCPSTKISVNCDTSNDTQINTVYLEIEDATTGQIIPSTMHGVIFETNINRGDDGGLYAELIYNRAFQEKSRSLDGWSIYGEGSISLSTDQPVSKALPTHVKFLFNSNSTVPSGLINAGFYGIKIQVQIYSSSFFYKPLVGAFIPNNKLSIGFRDLTGRITYGMSIVDVSSALVDNWTKFSNSIIVHDAAPTSNNIFFIEFPQGSSGEFEFNLISCFPPTYKNRMNGARIDIANTFAELKPGFIRLPGGNDLEGHSISERFIWNNTIGSLEYRPGRKGTWTGYNTQGFGLIELLTFAEDIGAIPILAVYAGYSLDQKSVPKDELQPYIDEVIDEIEFLTAPANKNRMGALRASIGRQEPFNIKYVEIGNEDWLGLGLITYSYRWPAYYNALSKRYPNITFIATTTTYIRSPPATDDHHYRGPLYFIENFRHYEKLSRLGPKVLIGEFSVDNNDDLEIKNSSQFGRLQYPSIKSAVAESVYRIGFERNSDIVIGGCYAPVLQNINNTQWTPNFILFNASLVIKSTSYLAQQMFGEHVGNIVLNSTAYKNNNKKKQQNVHKGEEGDGKLDKLYFIATKDTKNNTLIIKFANVDSKDILVNTQIKKSSISSDGIVYTLSAGSGVDPSTIQNTLSNPNAASIITSSIFVINGTCSITVPSWSVVVVTIPL
ncbi:unnamed protein product [Rotaria sp. Silwood1]|nr:unnamed protein product [Rotaria sp. Silwood1]